MPGIRQLRRAIESRVAESPTYSKGLLQSYELYQYVVETSVYPREPELLMELREVTAASHPMAPMATAPLAGQIIAMLLQLIDAKRTIEIGVFTGYSLLLTALNIPEDGKIVAVDVTRDTYEIGLPVIRKAGMEHKIDFVQSESENKGSFDFAFVDADKINYRNYHERLMRLLRVGGLVVFDNTLWGGTVAMPEEDVPVWKICGRRSMIELNESLARDDRIELCHAPIDDGMTICRRIR